MNSVLTTAEQVRHDALPVELQPAYEHERELYDIWMLIANNTWSSDRQLAAYDAWSEANDTFRELLEQCSRRGRAAERLKATRCLTLFPEGTP